MHGREPQVVVTPAGHLMSTLVEPLADVLVVRGPWVEAMEVDELLARPGVTDRDLTTAGAQPTLRGLHHSTPGGSYVGPKGLGQSRGRPELLDLPSTAQDPATATRLWELTEQVLDSPLPV